MLWRSRHHTFAQVFKHNIFFSNVDATYILRSNSLKGRSEIRSTVSINKAKGQPTAKVSCNSTPLTSYHLVVPYPHIRLWDKTSESNLEGFEGPEPNSTEAISVFSLLLSGGKTQALQARVVYRPSCRVPSVQSCLVSGFLTPVLSPIHSFSAIDEPLVEFHPQAPKMEKISSSIPQARPTTAVVPPAFSDIAKVSNDVSPILPVFH